MGKRKLVPRTRNAGTMTEAAYFSMIRSALRKGFRFWKPISNARMAARRSYKGSNPGQKWEYQCADCKRWFLGREVAVDHIVPVGSLRSLEDLPGFVERLTAEDGFQVLCNYKLKDVDK